MSDLDRVLLSSMKERVLIEAMIYKTKQEFAEQVSNIITRLEIIESELKALRNKK